MRVLHSAAVLLVLACGFLAACAAPLSRSMLPDHSAAPVKQAAAASATYTVANQTWSNCDPALPVQMDDQHCTVSLGNVFSCVRRLRTKIAIPSAVVWINLTATTPGQPTEFVSRIKGIESVLTWPAALPIAAGTANMLLNHFPQNIPSGMPARHEVGLVRILDAQLNVIGCIHEEGDILITHSDDVGSGANSNTSNMKQRAA